MKQTEFLKLAEIIEIDSNQIIAIIIIQSS